MTTWLKIKVWTKIVIFAIVLIYAAFFFFFNSNVPVQVWVWFGPKVDTSLLPLIFSIFFAGVVAALLGRMVFRTIRQLREISSRKKETQFKQDVAELKNKADMLQTKPAVPQ